MNKDLIGLKTISVGAGLIFALLTCTVTNAQMKTIEQIREENRKATELINEEKERKLAEQRLEEEKRRAAEQKLKEEKGRVVEQKALDEKIRREWARREQTEQKAEKKDLKKKRWQNLLKTMMFPALAPVT